MEEYKPNCDHIKTSINIMHQDIQKFENVASKIKFMQSDYNALIIQTKSVLSKIIMLLDMNEYESVKKLLIELQKCYKLPKEEDNEDDEWNEKYDRLMKENEELINNDIDNQENNENENNEMITWGGKIEMSCVWTI